MTRPHRPAGSAIPRSCSRRGPDHERDAHGQQRRDDASHSRRGLPPRRPGRRAAPSPTWPTSTSGCVRHRLRHQRRSPFSGLPARRRWPACSTWCRATCRGTAWRRSGRGARGRWSCCSPRIGVPRDDSLRGGCRGAGRRLCDRRPRPHDFGRCRGDAGEARTSAGGSSFSVISLVFAYTTVTNVIERPDGIKIAVVFIGAIIATSLVSRVLRSTELRIAARRRGCRGRAVHLDAAATDDSDHRQPPR